MKFVVKKSLMILFLVSLIVSKYALSSLSAYKQYSERTAANDWGKGSIFYLDRHNVDCGPGRILRGFHLFRPSESQIAYEFACLSHSLISNETYEKQTGWNDTGYEFSSTNHLDRHEINCGRDMIQQFQLIRQGKKIAYKYRCVKAETIDCKLKENEMTLANIEGLRQTIYLDRQRVLAEDNYGLNAFRLYTIYDKRNENANYSYRYTYCKLGKRNFRPEPVEPQPNPNEMPSINDPNPGTENSQSFPDNANNDYNPQNRPSSLNNTSDQNFNSESELFIKNGSSCKNIPKAQKKEEDTIPGYYPAMGPIRKPNSFKIFNTSEYLHIHYLFDYLDTFFIKKYNQTLLNMITAEFERIFSSAKNMPKTDNRYADPYTIEKLIFYFSNGAAGVEPFTDHRLKSSKTKDVKVIAPGTDEKGLMKTLATFNKNLANKNYSDMISPIQVLQVLQAWQWGKPSESKDIMDAKRLLDMYDFNGDGALDREELILFSILHNSKYNYQCKDYCYQNIITQVIDSLFFYLDCDNDGYINAENIWDGLRNIYRQDKNYDMYSCVFPLDSNKLYRTNAVNDFVLKNSQVANGFLNIEEFRKGILLGYWERQVKDNVIYKNSEINNKIKRWGEAGAQDLECEIIKNDFLKKK